LNWQIMLRSSVLRSQLNERALLDLMIRQAWEGEAQ